MGEVQIPMAKEKTKTNESKEKKSVRRPAEPTAQRPADRFDDFQAQSLQRVIANPALATPADILALGRPFGNRAVQRLLARRQRGREGFHLDDETAGRINRARGGGQPLAKGLQEQLGAHMGHDFSRVRIHTGTESDELNRRLSARAFASGRDIFFRRGEYNPGSASGRELVAHELTHVVQQSAGRITGGGNGIAVRPGDDPFEREAEDQGRRAARSSQRAENDYVNAIQRDVVVDKTEKHILMKSVMESIKKYDASIQHKMIMQASKKILDHSKSYVVSNLDEFLAKIKDEVEGKEVEWVVVKKAEQPEPKEEVEEPLVEAPAVESAGLTEPEKMRVQWVINSKMSSPSKSGKIAEFEELARKGKVYSGDVSYLLEMSATLYENADRLESLLKTLGKEKEGAGIRFIDESLKAQKWAHGRQIINFESVITMGGLGNYFQIAWGQLIGISKDAQELTDVIEAFFFENQKGYDVLAEYFSRRGEAVLLGLITPSKFIEPWLDRKTNTNIFTAMNLGSTIWEGEKGRDTPRGQLTLRPYKEATAKEKERLFGVVVQQMKKGLEMVGKKFKPGQLQSCITSDMAEIKAAFNGLISAKDIGSYLGDVKKLGYS